MACGRSAVHEHTGTQAYGHLGSGCCSTIACPFSRSRSRGELRDLGRGRRHEGRVLARRGGSVPAHLQPPVSADEG